MTDTKQGPIEVWLSKGNMEITCRVVNEDESVEFVDVQSLSMRGAQREMTGWAIDQGYTPAGRWDAEVSDPSVGVIESSRQFKPGAA